MWSEASNFTHFNRMPQITCEGHLLKKGKTGNRLTVIRRTI